MGVLSQGVTRSYLAKNYSGCYLENGISWGNMCWHGQLGDIDLSHDSKDGEKQGYILKVELMGLEDGFEEQDERKGGIKD